MNLERLAYTFGILGYIALYLQAMWFVALIVPFVTESPFIKPQTTTYMTPVTYVPDPPSIVTAIFSLLIIIAVIALAIFAIIKGPGLALRKSDALVHDTSDKLVPIIIKGRKVSKHERTVLSLRVEFIMKAVLAVVLFCLLCFTFFSDAAITGGLAVTVGGYLLAWTLLWFSLQLAVKLRLSRR